MEYFFPKPKMKPMTDHEKIHRLRLAAGLSQKEFTAKIGFKNQSRTSKIETGKLNLKTKMKEDILNALGITNEKFEKLDEKSIYNFHQEHNETANQTVNKSNLDEVMEIVNELAAPYKAHISALEEEKRFLKTLLAQNLIKN